MSNLNNLRQESINLYIEYRAGIISEKEYIEKIRPIDYTIDTLELESLRCYLQGILVSEKSSLKHLH